MWMKDERLHRLYGEHAMVRKAAMNIVAWLDFAMLGGHKDAETLQCLRRARRDRESLLSGNEAFMVHSVARAQSTLDGVMAEVGVYQGCSARLISEASGGRPLHLFDTFEGLPAPGANETRHLRQNQYCSGLDHVKGYLADRPDIHFHRGLFPETAVGLKDLRFSFVHLDVDLKSSTRACLDFFYPRLVVGGVIMTHDYSYLDGVREAFREFADGRAMQLIELPTSQAILIGAEPRMDSRETLRARRLVRAVGVEPTLLSEPDFESGASTNSTTPACARESARYGEEAL